MPIQQMLLGIPSGDATYVDDLYAEQTYTGNNSTLTVNNGIDLDEFDGLVITKRMDGNNSHSFWDTKRGALKHINSNNNAAEDTAPSGYGLTTFNSNGFTLGTNDHTAGNDNEDGESYFSWCFRCCPKFFSIQTWTGNGTAGRTVAHGLESVPGMIIVKRLDGTDDWVVYHRTANASGATPGSPQNYYNRLNKWEDIVDDDTIWNDTAPTSSVVTLGTNSKVNGNNNTYVGYFFAHNEAAFGASGSEVISYCSGENADNQSGNRQVDLGWRPQFTLYKTYTNTGWNRSWFVVGDVIGNPMRHPSTTMGSQGDPGGGLFRWNEQSSVLEDSDGAGTYVATSGTHNQTGARIYASGGHWLGYHIRRPDGFVAKPPSAGTDLLALTTGHTNTFTLSNPVHITTFQVSMWQILWNSSGNSWWGSREQGHYYDVSDKRGRGRTMSPNQQWSESILGHHEFGSMCHKHGYARDAGSTYGFGWREGKSFTTLGYWGTGSSQTVAHLLNAVPTFIIVKARNKSNHFAVYHAGLNQGSNPEQYYLQLDNNSSGDATDRWNDTQPTSSVFTVGSDSTVNENNEPYVAYLWADSDYSKAGAYIGNGSTQTISLGFQPRFLVIRRYNVGDNTSGSPDASWIVFATNQGWGSSGNDTVKWWNKNSGPSSTTDYCDPTSTGFTLNAGEAMTNNNNDKYIYFAHA